MLEDGLLRDLEAGRGEGAHQCRAPARKGVPPATDSDAMREGAGRERHQRRDCPAGRGHGVAERGPFCSQAIQVGRHTRTSGIAQGIGTKAIGNDEYNDHVRETNAKQCTARHGSAQNPKSAQRAMAWAVIAARIGDAMTVLTREIEIDASAESLWQHIADVTSWVDWQHEISESAWAEDSKVAAGSRFAFCYRHNEASPRVEAEVSALRPNKEFSFKPVGGDLPYTEGMTDLEWEWLLFPQRSGRTWVRFTLTYQAEGGSAFFREMVGTRVQFLNFADSALTALRAIYEDEAEEDAPA